jgi:hypothetical protein
LRELIDIMVQKLHETDKAYLVTDSIPEQGVWIAKSQCELEESERKGLHILTLPEWLAQEKGLI